MNCIWEVARWLLRSLLNGSSILEVSADDDLPFTVLSELMGSEIGFMRNLSKVPVCYFPNSNCSVFVFIWIDFYTWAVRKKIANFVSFWPIFHRACRILLVPLQFSCKQLTLHVNSTPQSSYFVFPGKKNRPR
jgi:hypothetical protein